MVFFNKLHIIFSCTLFKKKRKVNFPNKLKKITMICHKKNKFWSLQKLQTSVAWT